MSNFLDNFPIFTNAAMTGDLHSSPINAQVFSLGDVQAVWTGSPVGSLFLETSDDPGTVNPDGSVSGLVNWSTYTGSATAAGGGAGNFSWHIWANTSRWVRLSYTFSSGSGTINARANQKE